MSHQQQRVNSPPNAEPAAARSRAPLKKTIDYPIRRLHSQPSCWR